MNLFINIMNFIILFYFSGFCNNNKIKSIKFLESSHVLTRYCIKKITFYEDLRLLMYCVLNNSITKVK